MNNSLFRFLCWLGRNNLLPPFIWSVGSPEGGGWANFYLNLPFCENVVISGGFYDVAVFDYDERKVFVYRGLQPMLGEETEEFLEKQGHRLSACDWMGEYCMEVVDRRVEWAIPREKAESWTIGRKTR